ncbi:MAG TPA: phosphatidylglycerol lysyltransferase domain-containing protein [Candidatus Dormibacteraeota bacterium]|nr:phosphatidylglycerol lysyltransferase domain-containing protein [Candidatus Dormibacteraeota bacterium]
MNTIRTTVNRAGAMVSVTLRLLLTAAALGTTGLAVKAWIDAPHAWQPAGLAVARVVGPLSLALIIITVPAVLRLVDSPKRALRDVLLIIAAVGVLLGLAAGSASSMMLSSITLIALVLARRLWSQLSDPGAKAQGWTLLGAAGIATLALLLFDQPSGMLLIFFAVLSVAAVAAAAWGLTLVVRNAPLPLESDSGPLRATYRDYAVSGVSPFVLMADKRWFWSRDRKAFLAYGLRSGVAVVLGPGVGPAVSVQALYREFRAACHAGGWKLGFYQVPGDMMPALGWGVQRQIGSEAIVDLGRLSLEGPAMAKLRHEVSRGQRNGITVQLMPRSEVTPAIREAMGTLASSWLGGHVLGEMTFSVGCRADQPEAPATVGLAYNRDGTLVAYCSWLAVPANRGIVLDEIRRTAKTPGGAMDLLLYSCMKQLGSQAAWASLGLAPVAAEPPNRLAAMGDHALIRLGIASVSASLVSFKGKFQPRWEARYIVAEKASDWPALAVATLALHYPDLEKRVYRFMPQLSWRRQTRVAAALTGALVAAGTSGILVSAAQSREGHPLYQARLAAIYVGTVLPATGPPKPPTSRERAVAAPREHGTHHTPPRPALTPKHLTPSAVNRTLADLDPQGRQLHTPIHSPLRTRTLSERQAPSPPAPHRRSRPR